MAPSLAPSLAPASAPYAGRKEKRFPAAAGMRE
jgi:hypothetical protein